MIAPGSVLPAGLGGDGGLRIVTGVRRVGGDDVRPLLAVRAIAFRRDDAPQEPAAGPPPTKPAAAPSPSGIVRPRPSAALLDLASLAEAQRPQGPPAGDRRGDADGVVDDPTALTPEERRAVAALRQRDAAVRQEEETHAAQAGRFAGAPIYEFVVGPDGKRYRVAGEVPVRAKLSGSDPDEARRALAVLALAASAPNAPSAQDFAVFRRAVAEADESARPRIDLVG